MNDTICTICTLHLQCDMAWVTQVSTDSYICMCDSYLDLVWKIHADNVAAEHCLIWI